MAGRATKKAVEQAVAGPDYGAALSIINGRIANAKSAQSKASGEAGQAWASIEKMGIHKGGAQAAAKVMGMEDDDDQQDYLRSFAKILEAAGITLKADLVDVAEGKHDRAVVPVEGLTPNHGRATAPWESEPDKAPPSETVDDSDLADGAAGLDLSGDAPAASAQQDDEPAPKRAGRSPKPKLSIVAAIASAKEHLGTAAAPDALD